MRSRMQAENESRVAWKVARGVDSSRSLQGTLLSRLTGFIFAFIPHLSAGQERAAAAGQAPLVVLGDKNYPPVAYLEEGVA